MAKIAFWAMLCSRPAQAQDLQPWAELVSYRPATELQVQLAARSLSEFPVWRFQRVEDGCGVINLDYYAVRIRRMPTVGGQTMSAQDLLRHVRLHLDDFLDHSRADIAPLSSADSSRWNSASPVGAVLSFTLKYRGHRFENGSVVATASTPNMWRFSTALTSPDWGHPVSGNREFGVREEGEATEFYTRGADRPNWGIWDYWIGQKLTSFANSLMTEWGITTGPLAPVLLDEGDAIWRGVQTRLVSFVNQNGGEAEIVQPVLRRPGWTSPEVQAIYRPTVNWANDFGFIRVDSGISVQMWPIALNAERQMLLTSEDPRSWLWSDTDGDARLTERELTELLYAGAPVTATDLNEGGDIVGFSGARFSTSTTPLIFEVNNGIAQVEEVTIPGSQKATFESISNSGVIGGTVRFPTSGESGSFAIDRGFMWNDANGDRVVEAPEITYMQPIVPSRNTEVLAVADGGWAVGTADNGQRMVAVIWRDGAIVRQLSNRNGIALAVDDTGNAVGQRNRQGGIEAFRLNNAVLQRLPDLGGNLAFAVAMNSRGEIVGNARQGQGQVKAVRWRPNLKILDEVTARPQGLSLTHATAVSPSGIIATRYVQQGRSGFGILYPFSLWGPSIQRFAPALCQ